MYFGLKPMLIFTQKVGLRKIFKQNPMYFGLNPMLISGGGLAKSYESCKSTKKNFEKFVKEKVLRKIVEKF